jgi:hypothetical protein
MIHDFLYCRVTWEELRPQKVQSRWMSPSVKVTPELASMRIFGTMLISLIAVNEIVFTPS